MNRNEAVSYLKDLLNECDGLSPNAVSFEQVNAQTACYTLRIRGSMHASDIEIVRSIAKKHSLQVRNDKDSVLVFRPT